MRVAIYDLDKTLVRRATFTPFLAFAAAQLAPWRLLLLPVWVLMMVGYRIGLYNRTALKTAGMRLMLGSVSLERLEAVGRTFADKHLEQGGWIEPVIALVEEDRREGAQIIVATAAFEFYAKAFASKLGIEHLIATGWDGRAIPGGNCYGEEKRDRVNAWLKRHGEDAHLRFVSDSFADMPLLDEVDDPIFVTTSASKRDRAKAKGWRVIEV